MNPLQEANLFTSPISGKLVRRRLGKKLVMAEDARSGAARSAKLAEPEVLISKATSNLGSRPNWGMHQSRVRGHRIRLGEEPLVWKPQNLTDQAERQ